MRQEIVQRYQAGASIRSIAKDLGIARDAVTRALARVQAQRDGRAAPLSWPQARQSLVDPFEPILKELLAQYPHLTVERALQELRQRGFRGGYTVVRQRVRLLRPRSAPEPVPRFETGPAQQALGILVFMTSTSPAKAGDGCISSAICSALPAGSTCAGSRRWT